MNRVAIQQKSSFFNVLEHYRSLDIPAFFSTVTRQRIQHILTRDYLDEMDFLSLLSPAAHNHLEAMAQRAHELSCAYFGRVIFLFAPLYISNLCKNYCRYCSFAADNRIARKHLSFDEIREEARKLSDTGIRHVLVLTGEDPDAVPPEYLRESVSILKHFFSSVAIEVYPLSEQVYGDLIEQGVDSLTLYQEVYDTETYASLHSGGPKHNYQYRLEGAERACRMGMHGITVGALLGLAEYRSEAFFTGLHAWYLSRTYPGTDISVSVPRLRPLRGDFTASYPVPDPEFVQIILALRLFLPFAGITVSTRESASMRNHLLPLGVTKMSASVSTAVGEASGRPSTPQFEIADTRSVEEMREFLRTQGYQPVLHDWSSRFSGHE